MYTNFIDELDVSVIICADDEFIDSNIKKQLGEVLSLFHILLVVGVRENNDIVKLLLDTLVGLGLTVTDGKGLVVGLAKEICKNHETCG